MNIIHFVATFFLFWYPVGKSFAVESISVGSMSLTIQQYDYLLANFKKEYKDRTGTPPPADSIAVWEYALKDRLYLLADATKKGYAVDHFVNRIVSRAEITMLTQPHGLLYDEVVIKTVQVTEKDIAEAYECMEYDYEIQYINISGGEDNTEKSFDRSYDAGLDTGTAGTMTLRWPFGRFYAHRQYILGLEAGQVSRPLETENGIMVIRVNSSKRADRKSFEEMAPSIRTVLEHYEELRVRDKYEGDIQRTAHIAIDTAAVSRFSDRFGEWETAAVDTSALSDIRDLVLATYVRDTAPVRITDADFLDYYDSLFMRKRLDTAAVVTNYLREMVFEVFAYADAVSRGLNQTETFVNDKWNYKNTVMLGEYEKREIDPLVMIAESDCLEYYDMHRDRFVDGEIAVADILTFSSRTDAERMRMRLMDPAGADSVRIPEPDIKYTTDHDVAIRFDIADYPDDVRAILFAMEDGRVSRVFEGNEEGKTARVFVKKTETGRRQQQFEEVQKTIYRDLFKEKKAAYKRTLIDSLKTVYPMTSR